MTGAATSRVAQGRQLNGDPDRSIVAQIAAGDHDSLSDLYGRYQRPLYAYLCLLTSDPGLAEEILQDTLLAVWTGARTFQGRSSVRGWLYGIARRQAHNALRRAPPPTVDESVLEAVPGSSVPPEEAALAAVACADLEGAILGLSPPLREVVLLTLVHGLSYQETAKIIGVPIGTVRSRLSNARRLLRPVAESLEWTS